MWKWKTEFSSIFGTLVWKVFYFPLKMGLLISLPFISTPEPELGGRDATAHSVLTLLMIEVGLKKMDHNYNVQWYITIHFPNICYTVKELLDNASAFCIQWFTCSWKWSSRFFFYYQSWITKLCNALKVSFLILYWNWCSILFAADVFSICA